MRQSVDTQQLKFFESFIQEATLQAMPQIKLCRVEAPYDGELVNWPEPIQVSIMSFQSEKIQGTALMGCDMAFLEQTCPGLNANDPAKVALLQDWLGELSNLVLGRIKNKILPFDIILKLNPPSVSESSEEIFASYANRKSNLKLWFQHEQQHFCVAFSLDVSESVDFSVDLMEQGHTLQPGDAIYRLNEENRSAKKYDVISKIRSGVITDDDPALHDDFDFDYDSEVSDHKSNMADQLTGVDELERAGQIHAKVQEPISVGKPQGKHYPDIQNTAASHLTLMQKSQRRHLEAVEWGDNGELSLRFAGENVVRLAPAILLTRGIMSLMVEGYKVDINALQNGLQVTIPELQIVLQNSFRAA